MKITLRGFLFGLFMGGLFFGLIYSIQNVETPEEYRLRYDNFYEECMKDAPEGSICLVDVFPQPPYPLFILGVIVSSVYSYFLILKAEKEEVKD